MLRVWGKKKEAAQESKSTLHSERKSDLAQRGGDWGQGSGQFAEESRSVTLTTHP